MPVNVNSVDAAPQAPLDRFVMLESSDVIPAMRQSCNVAAAAPRSGAMVGGDC